MLPACESTMLSARLSDALAHSCTVHYCRCHCWVDKLVVAHCTYCNLPVGNISGALACNLCSGFTHDICCGLSASVRSALRNNQFGLAWFCVHCAPSAAVMIQRNRLNADIARRYDLLQHSFTKFSNEVSERLLKLEDAVRSHERSKPVSKSTPSSQPPLRSSHDRDDVSNNASSPLRPSIDDVANNASDHSCHSSTNEAGKQTHSIVGQINEQFITCRRTNETKNRGARSKRNTETDTVVYEAATNGLANYGHQPQLPGAAATRHFWRPLATHH
jgi:hypothetical protein